MPETRKVIDPFPGDEHLTFRQGGVEVSGTHTLYLSGQTSIVDGRVAHVGDLAAQVMTSMDNIGIALDAAGYRWSDVVRLNWYLLAEQIEAFRTEVDPALKDYLDRVGCKAPGVLLGVVALAFPDLLCEAEATAVR